MRNIFFLLIGASFLMVSCQDNLSYSEFRSIDNEKWYANTILEFEIAEIDTVKSHNVFITIRNDQTFEFSNLFLITEFEKPNGKTTRDTLEYLMAKPNGEWLGTGHGSIKENKLWYKENIDFKDSGVYRIRVSHAMRKNGKRNGIKMLQGITDVGVQVEKIQ
jgi:gliding motility-associated lipoprotein GldH